MINDSAFFEANTREALGEAHRTRQRRTFARYMQEKHSRGTGDFAGYEGVRQHVKTIRDHTLDNLSYYLEEFEKQAVANGNQLHWAATPEEFNRIVLDICRQRKVKRITKGKSMVTEETDLRGYLEDAGLEITETDLGEYIIQQAGETPSHIVGPAMHKTVDEIRDLFLDSHPLGERELASPDEMVGEARSVLRQRFLEADLGIIGANALIAENGYAMLVTNEGNGDLGASLPETLIVCTTIDRLVPRMEDATAVLRLLARAAIGVPISSYASFYSGPRREQDPEGPRQAHIVLLDHNRSQLLGGKYQDMLRCIRCGSCLTFCPIYNNTGGHAYGTVYTGPMGSVLTPLLNGLESAKSLPSACTACGRCAEACPADIPLPDLLRDLRSDINGQKLTPRRWRCGLKLHAWMASHPRLYQTLAAGVIRMLHLFGRKRGAFRYLPGAGGWTSQRDFPVPQEGTFMHLYQRQEKYREQ